MNRAGIIDFFARKRDKRVLRCSLGTKEEEDAEEDDEENYPVDYDYSDYETATITSDTDLIAGGSLPIFLAEPVDTFVVKGKPATLHCRAAHALQVRIYRNHFYSYLYMTLCTNIYSVLFSYYISATSYSLALYEYVEVSFPRDSQLLLELSTKCLCLIFISFLARISCAALSLSLLVLITHLAAI